MISKKIENMLYEHVEITNAYNVELVKANETLLAENKRLKEALTNIKYSVKSCRAGDGDNRTWEQCAIDCETAAEEILDSIASTYDV